MSSITSGRINTDGKANFICLITLHITFAYFKWNCVIVLLN